MIRLGVVIPAYGHRVDVSHVSMWLHLGIALEAHKRDFEFVGVAAADLCNIAQARNSLVMHGSEAMRADWLLTVDADTAAKNSDAILTMINDANAAGAAAVAAPVKHRAVDMWNVNTADFGSVPETDFIGKVVPCASIGAACMAINLNWLKAHWPTVNPEPWFRFIHGKDNRWMGEDLAFCLGVRERGGVVLCDGRVECVHRGRAEYV